MTTALLLERLRDAIGHWQREVPETVITLEAVADLQDALVRVIEQAAEEIESE
jgi:hypothetical protein